MKHLRTTLVGLLGAALTVPAVSLAPAAAQTAESYDVLVVGKTTGFRHSSIDEATTAIMALGAANGFTVDVWDPPVGRSPGQPALTMATTPFTSAEALSQYATVLFASPVDGTNNQDPARPRTLDDTELAALQGYIRSGGGFVGREVAPRGTARRSVELSASIRYWHDALGATEYGRRAGGHDPGWAKPRRK